MSARRRRTVLAHACPGCRSPWAVRALRNPDGVFLLVCRFCEWRDVRPSQARRPAPPPVAAEPAQHLVVFPDSEQQLLAVLVDHVAQGLSEGRPGLVIATEAHRAAVESALLERGTSADGLLLLDAEATLAMFLRDGRPDPLLFDASVGALVRDTVEDGRPVQAYGEMAALLWETGRAQAAIELEDLWNRLAERVGLSLLCACPAWLLADDPDGRDRISASHTALVA